MEVGFDPLDGVDSLHLHLAVEVHEFRLLLFDTDAFRFGIANGARELTVCRGIPVGKSQEERDEDNPHDQENINGHGFVGDRGPIDLDPVNLRLGRSAGRMPGFRGCLCCHVFLREDCANFSI